MQEDNLVVSILEEVKNYEFLLEEEMSQGGFTKNVSREKNSELLTVLLNHPEYSPKELEESVLGYKNVLQELRKNDLDSPKKRIQFVNNMKIVGLNMSDLVFGKSDNKAENYNSIARIVFSHYFRQRQFESKVFLLSMILFGEWENSNDKNINSIIEGIVKISKYGSYKLCREVTRRIVSNIGINLGFEKKKSRTEIMQSALEDLRETQDIDDYRATLLIVQRELNNLRDDVENEIKSKNEHFLIDFFSTMNSVKNSFLLDTIQQVSLQINDKNSKTYNDIDYIRKTLEIMVIIFKNLLKSQNIYPIEKIGKIVEVDINNLDQYEIESVSTNLNEIDTHKKIEILIKSSGWKFRDLIISKPKIEVINAQK